MVDRQVVPNFLLIGAMKAGTTSLYSYLRGHPQVFMSETKEINFFSSDELWTLGLDWYSQHFAGAARRVAVGEASPTYTMHCLFPDASARVAQTLPNAKLIYLVRHPIERIESHYAHMVATGAEVASIERAVLEQPMYVDLSRYAHQLDQFRRFFDDGDILVVTSEALRSDRSAVLRRVLGFLGVDQSWTAANIDREFHRTDQKRSLNRLGRTLRRLPGYSGLQRVVPEAARRVGNRMVTRPKVRPTRARLPGQLRLRLEEEFADDIRRIGVHIGPGFDGWGVV